MKLSDLLKKRKFWLCLSFLVVGMILNQIAGFYLAIKYKDSLPILHDALLDKLPYFHIAWLYDLCAFIPVLLIIVYVYLYKLEKAPYFIVLFGILQYLRAVFIVLTPFGTPNPTDNGIVDISAFRYGMYFSGHTGATFMAFLIAEGVWKKILFGFSIAVIVTLLIGRGHYSIDIFSAVIFAYAIYLAGEKHFKEKLSLGNLPC